MATGSDHAHVIAPPPVIALAALGIGFALRSLWPRALWPGSSPWVPATGCFLAAVILAGAAARGFWRARTAIVPHHPTTALVTSGPFRFTRNPFYLALGLVLVGVALAVNSAALLVMMAPWAWVMRYGVVAREERYLEGKFGEDYRAYCRRVRRWL